MEIESAKETMNKQVSDYSLMFFAMSLATMLPAEEVKAAVSAIGSKAYDLIPYYSSHQSLWYTRRYCTLIPFQSFGNSTCSGKQPADVNFNVSCNLPHALAVLREEIRLLPPSLQKRLLQHLSRSDVQSESQAEEELPALCRLLSPRMLAVQHVQALARVFLRGILPSNKVEGGEETEDAIEFRKLCQDVLEL